MMTRDDFVKRCNDLSYETKYSAKPWHIWLAEMAANDAEQRAVIAKLEAEHKDLVLRNKLLRDRPDLPLERIKAYDAVIAKIEQQVKENKALRELLRELHAQVQGECPSLLNEDSGGDAQLALAIEQALKEVS